MMRGMVLAGLTLMLAAVAQGQMLSTKDGLQLSFAPDGTIREGQFSRKRFGGVGGFFVAEPQDTPANLSWTPLKGKAERKGNTVIVQETGLGLELTATFTEQPDAIFCSGTLRDTTNADRAVVLAFALPMDATGWQWWDDLRSARLVSAKVATRYAATVRYGMRGEHSPYPFCAISTDDAGIALGIPLNLPVVHRFVYDLAQKQLRLEWDFGLSPDSGTRDEGRGAGRPSTAVFRFAIYALDEPRWGMRAAADKFYRLFPESFRLRVKRFGIWMPFTDIAKIADFEDFGFAYHEGAQNPDFNRKHGIYNFRYEEPWSAWFYLPSDAPTDLTLEQLFAFPNKREQHPNLAEIVKACSVQDEQGRFSMRSQKTDPVHWAGGQTLYNFLVNADPDIGRGEGRGTRDGTTKASAMDKTLQTVLTDERLDGVYFDGFGEWVMPNENYRRDHWRVADFPLTFSWRTKRPTQLAAFGIYEYLAHAAEQLHAVGKLVMANGFGYGFPFSAHWVDVGGNEIRWTRQRDDFAFFDYRRVLAYRKPYLPLNNEFFDSEFTAEVAEDYFRWSLFYGFLPSCFAPGAGAFGNYWNTPEFHNRDRHLFRRYIPLIVRLCQAGWEPVTHARSDNGRVLVERFGRWHDGDLHFTVYNTTDRMQSVSLWIDAAKLGLRKQDLKELRVWVLTDWRPIPFSAGETEQSPLMLLIGGTMAPRETACLWLAPQDKVMLTLSELARTPLHRAVSKSERRTQAPAELLGAVLEAAATQPEALPDWTRWLARLAELRSAWQAQLEGANVASDFSEAQRIVGGAMRDLLALETDAVLPMSATAGETLRVPVDIRNTGKETLKDAKLVMMLQLPHVPLTDDRFPKTELTLDDLPPKALRRELLTLTVPTDATGQRGVLRVMMHASAFGTEFALPVDEMPLTVLPSLELQAVPFGGEPSIKVWLKNNTGEAKKAHITVISPLAFERSEVTLKARMTTEVTLKPKPLPTDMSLFSAQVRVEVDDTTVTQWLSLIAMPTQSNLLRNGSFEDGNEPPLPNWAFYGVGYRLSKDAAGDGAQSILCDSGDTQTMTGAIQNLALNQTQPVPLLLHGFSKGEGVYPSGLGGDYSLYLDARYVDGTPLWGEIVPFSGARDGRRETGWEWGWRLIVPEKPLREVVVYALFRYRRGRAWFDSVGLNELRLPPNLAKGATAETKGKAVALTDGDFRTVWEGSGETSVVIALPSAVEVKQVAIWWAAAKKDDSLRKAESLSVEGWDGTDWQLLTERPTDADSWVTVVDFPPTDARILRVTLRGKDYAVRELEVR